MNPAPVQHPFLSASDASTKVSCHRWAPLEPYQESENTMNRPPQYASASFRTDVMGAVKSSPPLDPILNQLNLVHTHISNLKSISTVSSHLRLSLSSGIFPSGSVTKVLNAFLTYLMLSTCPTYCILLDLIILSEKYKSRSNYLHPLVTPSIFTHSSKQSQS